MPTANHPRPDAHHQTKLALIDAAGELFAGHGFDGTSTRAIAERAGVNLGAIHYHFGSKEALYVAAFRHACKEEEDEAQRTALFVRYQPELDNPASIAELIRDFVALQFDDFLHRDDPDWHLRLILGELNNPSAAFPLVLEQVFRPIHDYWLQIHRRVRPHVSDDEAQAWALQQPAAVLLHLNARSVVEQVLGRAYDDAYLASLGRVVARAMILELELPLPEDLR